MNDQGLRFRIGIFVLGALLLLGVLIILFGGFPAFFKHVDEYTVVFASAPGVSAGTPVRRSGVRIGEVHSLALDDETGKVHVIIHVDPAHTLREGDQPTLVLGLLAGDTSIDFLPPADKVAGRKRIEPGSTLEGFTRTDATALLQKTGELMPPAKETLDEMKKVFQRFDKMAPLMEETLKEYRELGRATRDF